MQVPRLRIALANGSSANIKLSNTQISKMVYQGEFLYKGILIDSFDIEASLVNFLVAFGKGPQESLKKKQEKSF